MEPSFVVAIPARFAATRLPGKPLRLLAGEPLVLHVARRALAAGAREVWVAADDPRIAEALSAEELESLGEKMMAAKRMVLCCKSPCRI